MRENLTLRMQVRKKKIKDMSLIKKIRCILFFLIITTILGMGIYGYITASSQILRTTKQTVGILMEQDVGTIDEHKHSFEEESYALLNNNDLSLLFSYSREEALALKYLNEGLPVAIAQQGNLYKYTNYALLQPNSGVIYNYYRMGVRKLDQKTEEILVEGMKETVDKHKPVAWVSIDDKNYFVRKLIDTDLHEQGILVIQVDESFFDFIEDHTAFLDTKEIIVLNRSYDVLLRSGEEEAAEIISGLTDFFQDKTLKSSICTGRIDGEKYNIHAMRSMDSGWVLVIYYSEDILLKESRQIITAMIEFLAVLAMIILLITTILSRNLNKNVVRIVDGMCAFEKGDFSYRIHPDSYDEIGRLGLQLNYMAIQIQKLILNLQKSEEEKRKMEISVLQAQINPHFLYNTLGSLKWAAYREGQRALANSLDALVKLLRFTIKRAAGMVTVKEEVDYVRNYIEIEKMRCGDVFSIEYKVDPDVEEMEIPGFLLQPMVENSLLHGLDLTKPDGMITISFCKSKMNGKDYICIEESDNGVGMSEKKLSEIMDMEPDRREGYSSLGVRIVDKRLRETYGEEYHMDIQSTVGVGTRITLWIPDRREL